MYFPYGLRLVSFLGAVGCLCGAVPSCSGGEESTGGSQVEIWLGNERVERPRLNRASPPRPSRSTSELTKVEPNELDRPWGTDRKPEELGSLQASRPIETGTAGCPERQTDTSAVFSGGRPSAQRLEPPETPRQEVPSDKLGQARLLLMQSIELTRRADALLGEAVILYEEPPLEIGAQSAPAPPACRLETTDERSRSPAGSSVKRTAAEIPLSGEEGSSQQSKGSNSTAAANVSAMSPPFGVVPLSLQCRT